MYTTSTVKDLYELGRTFTCYQTECVDEDYICLYVSRSEKVICKWNVKPKPHANA